MYMDNMHYFTGFLDSFPLHPPNTGLNTPFDQHNHQYPNKRPFKSFMWDAILVSGEGKSTRWNKITPGSPCRPNFAHWKDR